jgi:hypothetical protein
MFPFPSERIILGAAFRLFLRHLSRSGGAKIGQSTDRSRRGQAAQGGYHREHGK